MYPLVKIKKVLQESYLKKNFSKKIRKKIRLGEILISTSRKKQLN